MRDSLPVLGPALAEYRQNLLTIIASARRYGVRVVLLTQPSVWDQHLPARVLSLMWFGGVGRFQVTARSEYYSIPALMRGMRQYNAELLAVCADVAAECIDLAAQIPKDTTMFYDDAHFNEGGAQRVASIVASYLLTRPPFNRSRD